MNAAVMLRARLRQRMSRPRTLAAPGTFDPLSALQVERAGFEVAYVGSYALSTSVGQPDVGWLDLTTLCVRLAEFCNVLSIPLIADAEGGFFNAAGIGKAVRALERSGVSAIHIEDHVSGKHTNMPKAVLSTREMVQKIRAALDARADPNFQIIARTDIAEVSGNPLDALERMIAYLDAGADAVMPSALDVAQLATIRARIPGKVVLVNTAGASVADEQAAGVDLAIYHGLCLQAAQHAIEQTLRTFAEQRDIRALDGSLASRAALDAITGYEDFNRRAAKYGLIDP